MRLKDILISLDCKLLGPDEGVEVTGISCDSRNIIKTGGGKGALFAAIPGERVDGHAFIKNAVENGAACVLAERPAEGVKVPQVIVGDVREALSKVSDIFYGQPSKRLTVVGVTGTNGKTTITYLLESIFKEAGFNPGVIGTVNYRYGGSIFPAPHTTPQAPELHKILKEMADSGVTHCVMEVSSHSLEQKRVGDCRFKCGVFTNLTHDHLDYHHTMEEYFRCKSILFKLVEGQSGVSVINIDDQWGRLIKKDFPSALTYSIREKADISPKEYKLKDGGIEAIISTPKGDVRVSSHLVGEYNLHNILAAIGAASALGVDPGQIGRGVDRLRRVPGRLEKIEAAGANSFRAYVDYAHTGDALERALQALVAVAKGRIITVFGCGGNRDRLKRPRMGAIATSLSAVTIITSDNPRDEDPLEIIKEIEGGVKGVKKYEPDASFEGKGYMVIPDRGEAIKKAVRLTRSNDTVLVAGKGHEDYQIVKGKKFHFDDFEALNEAIKELSALHQ
ncbi:MAG: UDP-N-acetylmuramoyl-L-alanyl-D-glutamate--2,6-diaminopimelate ligase [Deltaproteobacteria bacterium]|nr:UDP-N-acetylmuramoyl-L-alanyl-D-glutamate--2,6-diaminopimelate ligase [Deltaproteobacteria bacterium]